MTDKQKHLLKSGFALLSLCFLIQSPRHSMASDDGFPDAKIQAAATECAQLIGVALPSDPDAFHAFSPAVKESFHACMQQKGITPPAPPSEKDRVAMDACLKEAGFTPPAFQPGQPPPPIDNISPALHEAMKSCHDQVVAAQAANASSATVSN